jgi:hypothetical protein
MNAKFLLSAIAVAATLGGSAYGADIVTSGDLKSVDKWYGRAGGLAGSDRVGALNVGESTVGVTFDQEVAARTNMSRDSRTSQVGVTWDRDVAARTNMPRDGNTSPASTATVPGPTHN